MRMTRNWNTELNKCEEFRTILAKCYIALSPTHVGGTAHISDGHFDQNGLLLTMLQGGVENETAQVQGPILCAHTARREKLEELNLLNRPFLFPCIITILTGTRCCLFWKQELTSAPSQEMTWDFVARPSRRASNLKYLPPAFFSTPIFGKMSRLLRGLFDLLSQNSAKSIETYLPSNPETYLPPMV